MFLIIKKSPYILRILVVLWFVFSIISLSSCLSNLWTGSRLIYSRNHLYKEINDYKLAIKVNHIVHQTISLHERRFIDTAVFNGDILLTGQVKDRLQRQALLENVSKLAVKRRVFNQINVGEKEGNELKDSLITLKIRSKILADADINPDSFKIITSFSVVYLMGNVELNQAVKVINIARNTCGVKRVVKLFKYYKLI